jgi:hypothetical protein
MISDRDGPKKKEQGQALLEKLCRPYFPKNSDLILIDGVTLLVRAGLLPRLGPPDRGPCGWPEPELVDHLSRLVINFSNDCSKFEQFAKRLGFRYCRL